MGVFGLLALQRVDELEKELNRLKKEQGLTGWSERIALRRSRLSGSTRTEMRGLFLATVRLRPGYDPSRNKPPQVFIVPGAFDHDYTTSVRLRKLINALYVAASPNSNQKAIQTLRDENVTYWGDDIIVL